MATGEKCFVYGFRDGDTDVPAFWGDDLLSCAQALVDSGFLNQNNMGIQKIDDILYMG